MLHRFCVLFFVGAATLLSAQLPQTNLHIVDLKKENKKLILGKIKLINVAKGYNNQPSFSNDQKTIYFVSADSLGQTDVYAYALRSKKTRKVTQTNLSEYSPQEFTNQFLHAVVVEKDSAQRIHGINKFSGLHEKSLLPDSVGYYCFLNSDSLVFYKLTEPHSLRLYVISTNSEHWIANSPTRSFKAINPYTLIYCLKDSLTREIYKYNFRLQKGELICKYNSENEDLFWHPQLGLMRSEQLSILLWNDHAQSWEQLFNFENKGLHRVGRFSMDVKQKHLVLVDQL